MEQDTYNRSEELVTRGAEGSIWRGFFFNVSAIILLFILSIFLGVQLNNEQLIENELYIRAKADFDNIVITRKWNADYHGTYVEKLPGVESNPYLEDPDITAADGRVYTKKNPALMTREISELMDEAQGHSFHISSLKPLNPDNSPNDPFETAALLAFEQGESERFKVEQRGGKSFYRYMAPLYVEPACLSCHAGQGYDVGDVRGGISVSFDISDVQERMKRNRLLIWGLSLTVSTLLLLIIYSFVRKVKRALDEANAKILEMAVTDELTGLYNRRYFMRRGEEELQRAERHGHSLSCIMIDIDHFKEVNDTYGHQAGDQVLKSIAHLMKAQGRSSDVLARYGGEEFVVMLPETGGKQAEMVAERLRVTVEASSVALNQEDVVQVTISAGVCCFAPAKESGEGGFSTLVEQADAALYRAKQGGRNRVESQ